MADVDAFEQHTWNLGSFFGIDSPLLLFNATALINTWFILLLLTALLFGFRLIQNNKTSVVRFLIFTGITSFVDLVTQTLGTFVYGHFAFITSIFIFILFCNCISVLPWTAEPTQDLNTALALGLVSFFYKEFYAIKTQGFKTYAQEFFHPFFLMFPVNVIGHFSKIISISFRLFGNIFGGSIIMELYKSFVSGSLIFELLGLCSGLNFLILVFFGIFEGLIQAFVFSMLTLTYLALAIQQEPAGEH